MAALTTETTDNGVLVAKFNESRFMDMIRIEQVGAELLELVPKATEHRLLLDFGGVSFMSSSMIGKLVMLIKKCEACDTVLKVCNTGDTVKELFKLTRLKIEVKKDRESAIASFDKKKSWFGFG